MHVHPRAVVSHDRLGHEGRRLAVGVRHHVHGVFENLHPVRALHERVELGADLVLARRRNLVMEHLDFDTLLLERERDRVADVLQGVDRRHRKVAAFDRGAMRHVAAFVFLAR